MAEILTIYYDSEKTIRSTRSFTCSWPTLEEPHTHSNMSVDNGYGFIVLKTSNIPIGADIDSVVFSCAPTAGEKDTGGTDSWAIMREGTTDQPIDINSDTNDKIKVWLQDNKKADGSFPDLSIRAYCYIGDVPHSGPSSVNGYLRISGERNVTYNSKNTFLKISYTPQIDLTKPSPTITNFKLRDTFRRQDITNIMASLASAAGEAPGTNSEKKADSLANCFFQGFSILNFSIGEATTSQSVKTILYDLVIKRAENEKSIIYEKTSSSDDLFEIPSSVFENEDFTSNGSIYEDRDENGNLISSFSYIPYNFYYTARDLANLETQIYGTIYLIKDYSSPKIENLMIERVDFEAEVDENGSIKYKPAIGSDGEYLITNGNFSIKKIPLRFLPEEEIIQYNSLSYKCSWTSDNPQATSSSEEFSKPVKIDSDNFEISESIEFLCGSLITDISSMPEYEFSYSPEYNYSVTVEVSDYCYALSKTIEILPAFSYLSIELAGVAIGERKKTRDDGEKTFDINLPTYVKQEVNLVENAAIKGIIILENGISYGEAEPSTIFTGANEETNPSPQEGQIYFRLL